MAGQISPCPDSTGADPCSNAQSTAYSVLSTFGAKTANAKAQLDTADKDLQNGAAPSVVLKEVGNTLSTINDGIKYAITEADTIPDSCPDESGNDICPSAKGAATQALASISRNYDSVKTEYDQLAGTVTQLTPEQQQDQQKNNELLSVHPKLAEAKDLRDKIKYMEDYPKWSGSSKADIDSSKAKLKDMEDNLTNTYESILSNSRYKNDFWTNWDYATLKKNQGDADKARQLFATALSSTDVDEKSKSDFMNKLRKDSQTSLGLSAPPSSDSSVIKSIGKDLSYMYDKSVWAKSILIHDFHCAYIATLAKTGKLIDDIKTFRDTITGKNTVVQPNQ
jgi:hypothetical protein